MKITTEETKALYESGKTYQEIADMCGVTKQAIHLRIKGKAKKNTPYVPRTCSECEHFAWATVPESIKKYGFDKCTLSNEITEHYANPIDRPNSRPCKCPYNPLKKGC